MPVTYPGGSWRPLGTQTQPRMASHEVICLHTMVGYLISTDDMFRDGGYGGTESHFGVGGKWGSDAGNNLDGAVWQWQDCEFTADANLEGNDRVLSIETADNAPQRPEDIEAWTPAQLDAIVDLVAWLCQRYDIPAVLISDTRPGVRGIGYHAQGTAAMLPPGAERWSTTVGKPCPTARRISQITSTVIPRVQAYLRGEDDEMSAADVTAIRADMAAARAEIATAYALIRRIHEVTLAVMSGRQVAAQGALDTLGTDVGDVRRDLEGLSTAIANIELSGGAVGDLTVSGLVHVAPPSKPEPR